MSDVTVTGLDEMYAATRTIQDRMTGRLQAIAAGTALRVKVRAQQNLRTKTHGTGATAKAIGIVQDLPRKQFQVVSQAPEGKPGLLPVWIEYGTRFQPARPFMRPAADAERDRYVRLMSDAAIDLVRGVFT